MDLVEVLSFLFMLSTMELGRVSHAILIVALLTSVDNTILTLGIFCGPIK